MGFLSRSLVEGGGIGKRCDALSECLVTSLYFREKSNFLLARRIWPLFEGSRSADRRERAYIWS